MKIAFVSFGHQGSTFPLAHSLCEHGHSVDYYIVSYMRSFDVEASDLILKPQKLGIQQVHTCECPLLMSYFSGLNVNIFSINLVPKGMRFHMQALTSLILFFQVYKLCLDLNKRGYDYINIIGRYNVDDIILFIRFLSTKIVVSLHEVCDHENPNFNRPSQLLKTIFDRNIPVVVHSRHSMNDILSYKNVNPDFVNMIPFGLFNSFSIFSDSSTLVLPEVYILFIGRIVPYKGLSVLYDAVTKYANLPKNVKIVVAGHGQDPVLSKIKNDDSFICINRFLSNKEFAELMQKSYCLVTPYYSISQSGIPQTCFTFSKPIIASRLEGFTEIISDRFNGLLFTPGDSKELGALLNQVVSDEDLYNTMCSNITNINSSISKFSWSNIVSLYLKLFK